jgi:uncharacterized membrane protein
MTTISKAAWMAVHVVIFRLFLYRSNYTETIVSERSLNVLLRPILAYLCADKDNIFAQIVWRYSLMYMPMLFTCMTAEGSSSAVKLGL